MKSILIIGLGKFGQHLCRKFVEMKNEVMVVDIDEKLVEAMMPVATSAQIGDCTNVEVLKSLGINNFDVCFVCIGTDFQSSLEITSLLKENGAKYVVSKATRDIQAKFLLRNGADEVAFPEKDMAEETAMRFSADYVYDYVELGDDFSIYEIPVLGEWTGRTVKDVKFRTKYDVNILGYKRGDGIHLLPGAEHIFDEKEHLLVIGKIEDVEKLLKHFEHEKVKKNR